MHQHFPHYLNHTDATSRHLMYRLMLDWYTYHLSPTPHCLDRIRTDDLDVGSGLSDTPEFETPRTIMEQVQGAAQGCRVPSRAWSTWSRLVWSHLIPLTHLPQPEHDSVAAGHVVTCIWCGRTERLCTWPTLCIVWSTLQRGFLARCSLDWYSSACTLLMALFGVRSSQECSLDLLAWWLVRGGLWFDMVGSGLDFDAWIEERLAGLEYHLVDGTSDGWNLVEGHRAWSGCEEGC